MKRLGTAVMFAIAGAAPLAHAGCKELAAAIEASQKELAFQHVDALLDNSAPRETNRQLRALNELQAIRANLVLMQSAKCPMSTDPIDSGGSQFISAAVDCKLAMEKNGIQADETKAACKRSDWARGKKAEAAPGR